MKKTLIALAVAGAASTASAADIAKSFATNFEAYGNIGPSMISGWDASLGIKFGLNFGKDLFGVKNLGATAFLARTSTDNGAWDWTALTIAPAATYTYPINAKLSAQGRAGLGIQKLEWTGGCWWYNCGKTTYSETGLVVVAGGGISYQLNDKLSVRADADHFGDWNAVTVGVGMKF